MHLKYLYDSIASSIIDIMEIILEVTSIIMSGYDLLVAATTKDRTILFEGSTYLGIIFIFVKSKPSSMTLVYNLKLEKNLYLFCTINRDRHDQE